MNVSEIEEGYSRSSSECSSETNSDIDYPPPDIKDNILLILKIMSIYIFIITCGYYIGRGIATIITNDTCDAI